jgi:serine/threonine protein kinase
MTTSDAATSSDADRDPVELMAQSFLERFRRGERPSVDEYAAKYPELAGEIRELLPALVQLECGLSVAGNATGTYHSGPRAATLRGAPRQLGDYTILREVGRGGMGVVYEAVQQSLGRHVALKVLPWQAVGDSSHLERFRLEARSAARLHHTNIVPVFGVGEAEGVHYYAMQFIHGQGLDAVIDELRRLRSGGAAATGEPGAQATLAATVALGLIGGRPPAPAPIGEAATLAEPAGDPGRQPDDGGSRSGDGTSVLSSHSELTGAHDRRYYRRVARLALQVAEGLTYAHGQGVLHRDIKPSNLLVDTRGTVWITDFGLAKAEGSDGPTRTGDIVGTLRYMAPERFEGHSDRRSDVYALGATVYELLTFRPLFGEVNRAKLVDRVLHEPPTAPRRLDQHVPRDLETIVLKALAKEPSQRYRDAEAMAADLRRFIDDRPILTRRVSTSEQVWRWCRRNPAVAILLALLLALMVGGTVAAGLAAHHFRALAGAESLARGRADALARTEAEAHRLASRRAEEAQKARAEADAKAAEAQAVADFLVMDLIGAASPGKGQGTNMTIGQALARADATIDTRFAGQPRLAATIHQRMGETYENLADLAKAESHWHAAAELRTRYLGPDARETLRARSRLFVVLRSRHPQEARTIAEEVLERQRRALGPEDPDTLTTMLEMGPLLFHYRDDRAPEYYRQLHEALARVTGPENWSTINALIFYGRTFLHRGNPDRAAEIFRQALELRVRGHDEASSGTFWMMNNLIAAATSAKRYDIAWTDAARFWPVICRNLDPHHYEFIYMNNHVFFLATATSDWARAESLFRGVSEALAAELGPGHVRALHARAIRARALAEQGLGPGALAVAIEVMEATAGATGPDTDAVVGRAGDGHRAGRGRGGSGRVRATAPSPRRSLHRRRRLGAGGRQAAGGDRALPGRNPPPPRRIPGPSRAAVGRQLDDGPGRQERGGLGPGRHPGARARGRPHRDRRPHGPRRRRGGAAARGDPQYAGCRPLSRRQPLRRRRRVGGVDPTRFRGGVLRLQRVLPGHGPLATRAEG